MSCGRLLGEEPETGVNDELAVVRGEREVGRRRGVMRNILWTPMEGTNLKPLVSVKAAPTEPPRKSPCVPMRPGVGTQFS